MANPISLDRRSLVETWPGAIIIGSSIVCFTVLVFCRLKMLLSWYHPYWKLPAVAMVLSHEDFIVLAILSFASLLLCFLSPRLRPYIASTHCILIIFIASVGFINSKVQPLYNAPVSMSLLDYSGARNFGSIHTLVGYLSGIDLVTIFIIFGLGPPAVYFTALIIRKFKSYSPRINGFVFVATALYVPFCTIIAPTQAATAKERTENAAVYLARSIFDSLPDIHSGLGNLVFDPYETELNTDQVFRDPGALSPAGFSASVKNNGLSPIRNVAIFVLESVGAQYLDIYGGAPDTTPHLRSLLRQSLLFSSAYAHVPSTPVSMFSILTSVYPEVAYITFPQKNPRIALPTLTTRLKQKGYRTGVFLSADARYAKLDEFLQDRGIDKMEDYRSRSCADHLPLSPIIEWGQFASTDPCTAASMEKWIEQSPEQPFFALMWTDETHFPYSTELDPNESEWTLWGQKDRAKSKERYLLGIREADAIIQDFVDFLDRRNLLRSTLIVVVGDHGEGFGQHGVFAHGSEVYDEFVRIPFILINPVLFDGKVSPRTAGLIDLAPTILGLLGERSPSSWQGVDLLGSRSRRYNYSFVTWSNFKISLRTQERSYIYDVVNNRVQVFDRKVDALEMQDMGHTVAPEEIEKIKLEIRDWKEKQDHYLNQHNSDSLVSDAMNK
jgi:lipoteichoic acid synthase